MTRTNLGRVVPAAFVLALVLPLSVAAAGRPSGHAAASARRADASVAFGRRGGNIAPFQVTITQSGAIRTSGAIRRSDLAPKVSTDAVSGILALARAEGFSTMPAAVSCRGSLPDFSASYVTIGSKTVAVRGSCRPAFSQLYAVVSAVAGVTG